MAAKKKRRLNVPRPYCRGTMTEAKRRSIIIGALRRIRYSAKYMALEDAFVKKDINPATGRMAKLYRCKMCDELFPASKIQLDHVVPVIPLRGFDGDYTALINRLLCEPEGLRALCVECHKRETARERNLRKVLKKDE